MRKCIETVKNGIFGPRQTISIKIYAPQKVYPLKLFITSKDSGLILHFKSRFHFRKCYYGMCACAHMNMYVYHYDSLYMRLFERTSKLAISKIMHEASQLLEFGGSGVLRTIAAKQIIMHTKIVVHNYIHVKFISRISRGVLNTCYYFKSGVNQQCSYRPPKICAMLLLS